jgi:type I restriction enzyme S subunit
VRFGGVEGEWKTTSIGHICKTFSGGTPSRKRKEYFSGSIPWIKSGEINEVNIYSSEETITQEGLQNSSAKMVRKGTVLLALYGATAGKVGISHLDAAINQALLAILPKGNDLDSGFLFFELQHQMPHILRKLQGGQPNLSAKLVKNSQISVPYIEEQRKMANVLMVCDDEIDLLQQKAVALRKQKKGLMQQLLTGKVRVKVPSQMCIKGGDESEVLEGKRQRV